MGDCLAMVETESARRSDLGVGDMAALSVAVSWVVVLARILRHRIFVSHDTIISYAHVWYISHRIWGRHQVPWRMPIVGHGRGFAFPYGLVPWIAAALIRPTFGDWSVTLLLVAGV